MLLRCTEQVDASADTVFACVDDPEHIVQWVSGAVGHSYVTERSGDSRVGQRFRQLLRQGKDVREFNGEVIAWTRPTHFGLSIPSPAYSSEAHFQIIPEGPARSTVHYSIDVTLHSRLAKLLGPLLKFPLGLFVKQQIGRLKAHAESLEAAQRPEVSRRSTAAGLFFWMGAPLPHLRAPYRQAAMTDAPAARLLPLHLGDVWVYAVSGTLTPPNAAKLPLGGEITVSIVADTLTNFPGGLAIRFARNLHILQPDGARTALPAPVFMFAIAQDPASGDVAIAADNMGQAGKARLARAPQVFYPGRWSPGTTYANRLEFDDGDYVVDTLAVVGQERVDTPAGSFLAWKAEVASESSAMGRVEGVDWWPPELGAPVRFSTEGGLPDGAHMRFVATLRSSNVVPG